MAIVVNLDVMLARRKMRLSELSWATGITVPNLSNLKTGKARAIRFSTLEAICRALECQPGDLLEHGLTPRSASPRTRDRVEKAHRLVSADSTPRSARSAPGSSRTA